MRQFRMEEEKVREARFEHERMHADGHEQKELESLESQINEFDANARVEQKKLIDSKALFREAVMEVCFLCLLL